jgi:hypothetical protein
MACGRAAARPNALEPLRATVARAQSRSVAVERSANNSWRPGALFL